MKDTQLMRVVSQFELPGEQEGVWASFEIHPDLREAGEQRDDVGALVVGGGQSIDRDLLERFPELKVVVRFGIGYDCVDVAECTKRGIQVGITPGPVETTTAELAIALMLSASWQILQNDALVRAGGWSPSLGVLPTMKGLSSRSLGLIGFGKVGQKVATRAIALGMSVSYFARHVLPVDQNLGCTWLPLDELLSTSDVVSLHLPLNAETHSFMNATQFGKMNDGALFINVARGPIVDEKSLLAELRTGRLAAALDVFASEPEVSTEFYDLDNVLLTPHIGSATQRTRLAMSQLVIDNLQAGLSGKRIPHPVPEQASLPMSVFNPLRKED